MSAPSTPLAGADVATVTPGDPAKDHPVRLVHSTSEILDLFVDILDADSTIRDKLKEGIGHLLIEHWCVTKWSDLKLFSSEDVKAALVSGHGMPEELLAPVIIKKVSCVVDYAKHGNLTADLTLDDIIGHLHQWDRKHQSASGSVSVSSPTRKGSSGSDSKYDKKNLPKLEKFSGLAEDYFAWEDATVTTLGIYGFDIFLRDDAEVAKYPGFGQSVFCLIRAAVHGGQAQSIAQAMVDDEMFDPVKLWKGLGAYYDTAVNRANVVLFDVRKLLSLRLDPDVSGSSFVSDFRDCLQRLRKHKAKLADDTDTLRAFLLVAIQDDSFETIRDSIVQKPKSTINDILTEIREREATLNLKDHHASTTKHGDGSTGSRHSRRSVKFASGTSSGITRHGESNAKKWSIPKFPDTWRSIFGSSFFKLMIEWHSAAHQGKTQAQLNDDFKTYVDTYQQKSVVSGKQSLSKKSRRAKKTKSGSAGSSEGADSGNDEGSSGPDQEVSVTRKRIRLQKSRRVLTERSA
jgi:hypothetical protein